MEFLGSICILIFIQPLEQDVYLILTYGIREIVYLFLTYGIREIVYKFKFVKLLLSLTRSKFSTVQ